MTEKIIEILKNNETLTECKEYFLVKRKDYQKVANQIELAINYTPCCTELKCEGCKKPLDSGLCGNCCSDLASGNY